VGLTLNSADHRASLDGNQVSMLSGIDPEAGGVIARLPGGKHIGGISKRASYDPSGPHWVPYRAVPFNFGGVANGQTARTYTTDSGTGSVLPVAYSGSFVVGECVAVYLPLAVAGYAGVYKITAITSLTSLTLQPLGTSPTVETLATGWSVESCCAFGQTAVGANTVFALSASPANAGGVDPTDNCIAWGIQPGMKVRVMSAGSSIKTDATAIIVDHTITAGNSTITFAASYTTLAATIILLPYRTTIDQAGILWSSTRGGVGAFSQGTDAEIDSTEGSVFNQSGTVGYPWSFTLSDRGVYAANEFSRPFRLLADYLLDSTRFGTSIFGNTLGFPALEIDGATIFKKSQYGSAADLAVGNYFVWCRLIDHSTVPPAKSPPIGVALISVESDDFDKKLLLDFGTLAASMSSEWTRATHIEIWRTTSTGLTYFLEKSVPISCMVRDSDSNGDAHGEHYAYACANVTNGEAQYLDYQLGAGDGLLVNFDPLEQADFIKAPPPAGRLCHLSQGVLFIAGKASEAANIHGAPRVTGDNVVYFSRTDTEEYENFPVKNLKVIGPTGSRIMGFVDSGSLTLVLMSDSYVAISRAGTYMTFDDEGSEGYGMPDEEAFCNVGNAAVWLGEYEVWVHQGVPNTKPIDIGAPIKDWIISARQMSGTTKFRLGYDSHRKTLWISANNTTENFYEALLYNFERQMWIKRENVYVDAFVTARTVESSTSRRMLYGFAGPNLYSMVDYDGLPRNHGGFSVLHGTWTATAPAGTYTNNLDLSAINFGSVANDLLIGMVITFTNTVGGAVQIRRVKDFVASGQVATVDSVTIPAGGASMSLDFEPHIVTVLSGESGAKTSAIIASISGTVDDIFIGQVVHVLRGLDTVGTRVITDYVAATRTISFASITLVAGDKLILGAIPFRLRFPPIRGDDVFLAKMAQGVMCLFADAVYSVGDALASLTVKFLSDYVDTADTGASGILTIWSPGQDVHYLTEDTDFVADIRATGHVIELQVEQLDRFVGFGIIYAGVPVESEGVLAVDQNPND
jgi:hypothetical protein